MAFFNSKKTAAETPIPEVMEEQMLRCNAQYHRKEGKVNHGKRRNRAECI